MKQNPTSINKLFVERKEEYIESFKERYWEKVDKSGDCWEWTAVKNPKGYGQIYWRTSNGEEKMLKSHRVGKYLELQEELDEVVRHNCQNKSCCRPSHLKNGSQQENEQDDDKAKLTEDEVVSIRTKACRGLTQREIGSQYGVSAPTVNYIVNGEAWQNVDGPVKGKEY